MIEQERAVIDTSALPQRSRTRTIAFLEIAQEALRRAEESCPPSPGSVSATMWMDNAREALEMALQSMREEKNVWPGDAL